uniref:Uncharacterized protein n=2 Tax=Candidatus Kentrum sp. FM TaxID=2126340 RepID=A0A450VSG4_9GAMM|nr:MAG: hypothetical protein BECKFM1743A_GA0114220_1004916 [Candidatus Kentron sp. FM]VFK07728.1 MAG: hypothetical protein BECKFM1743B_GA0114221_1004916 [Candidatus Kentron sp. FM]
MDTTTQPSDAFHKGKTDGIFLPEERDELGLTTQMREDIDRRLAIAQEEIRNGQYVTLDDEFMEKFLEEARGRNADILKAIRPVQSIK